MNRLFALAAADYGNLGDAVIRREAIKAFPGLCVQAYIGSGGADWIEALQLPRGAQVYKRRRAHRFLIEMLRARQPILLFDPGEVRLTRHSRLRETLMLCLTVMTRIKGGVVIRHARAVHGRDRYSMLVHRLACRMSDIVSWRNQESVDLVGVGTMVPDIAILSPDLRVEGRSVLAVSMRGDRDFPSEDWVASVRLFARARNLRIVAVSQVRADDSKASHLARALGGQAILFGSGSLLAQEQRVTDTYAQALMILSDRLHALILGANMGAVPVEFGGSPSGKISTHFASLNLPEIVIDYVAPNPGTNIHRLGEVLHRRSDILTMMERAAQKNALMTGPLQEAALQLLHTRAATRSRRT